MESLFHSPHRIIDIAIRYTKAMATFRPVGLCLAKKVALFRKTVLLKILYFENDRECFCIWIPFIACSSTHLPNNKPKIHIAMRVVLLLYHHFVELHQNSPIFVCVCLVKRPPPFPSSLHPFTPSAYLSPTTFLNFRQCFTVIKIRCCDSDMLCDFFFFYCFIPNCFVQSTHPAIPRSHLYCYTFSPFRSHTHTHIHSPLSFKLFLALT